MKFSVITLFPTMFEGIIHSSILKRAQESQKVTFEIINLRDFGIGKHKIVDDKPYGGGAGMILRVDVLHAALQKVKEKHPNSYVVLTDPKGVLFNQKIAEDLSKKEHITILAGHYEGCDKRIEKYADQIISLGDFILTGGEIPALAIIDSVSRLIPGVLGKYESAKHESFSNFNVGGILEHDHYTRPKIYQGVTVPEKLLSGNPKLVNEERIASALKNTQTLRPDLLKK